VKGPSNYPGFLHWPRALLIASIPAGIVLLLYAPSLGNEFVWDDSIVVERQLPAFHSITDVFFPRGGIPQFSAIYYRPAVVLSYLLDAWIWKGSPFGFHFSVIVLHAMNSALVFLLGLRLFARLDHGVLAALAGGILFATHPVQTEAVSWVAGRSDSLATFFALSSLLFYLVRPPGRSGLLVSFLAALTFLAACLSKETALGLLPVFVAADLLALRAPLPSRGPGGSAARAVWPAPIGPPTILGWGGLGAAIFLYMSLRHAALPSTSPVVAGPASGFALASLLSAFGFYCSAVVVPSRLTGYIPVIPHSSLAIATAGLALLAAAGLLW
jgi:hypothetical protein